MQSSLLDKGGPLGPQKQQQAKSWQGGQAHHSRSWLPPSCRHPGVQGDGGIMLAQGGLGRVPLDI